MVSQFVSTHPVALLGDLGYDFPPGTHAIGRLDNHSEGLLLLSTDKKVTRLLFEGERKHRRVYLVQVKNTVSPQSLEQLRQGIPIRVRGGGWYRTSPCLADLVEDPGTYFRDWNQERAFPPYSWLVLTLTEGKFHQVRKMVKALHHPCRRLIRISIEGIQLGDMAPGEIRELPQAAFFEKLGIDYTAD